MMKRFLWLPTTILLLCSLVGVTSCSDAEDPSPVPLPEIPQIIFDTDIGSSTDDLFALQMLNRYQDKGQCRLLGVVVNREGEDYAACVDIMDTYYGHPSIPIGLVRDGIKSPHVFIDYKSVHTFTLPDGNLMFQHTLKDYSTLLDGWQLYRKLLASQADNSVSIVSVGFFTCLAQLLESAPDSYSPLSGVELVRRKVKCLYIMGGNFLKKNNEAEYNLQQGIEFAKTFFRLWPSEVDAIFSPDEVGGQIEYKIEQVIADINWTDIHPIKQVYMNFNCDTGQKMWDPLIVINAVEGNSLFDLSERGNVTVSEEGYTQFSPSATGPYRYQLPGNDEWNTAMLNKIRKSN